MIVAPYDAELFGHWWFEGPYFLYYLFQQLHYDQNQIQAISPIEYLEMYPDRQTRKSG